MKLIELKCPGCGAQMLLDPVRKKAFCEYCAIVMAVDDKIFDDTPEEAPFDPEEAGYRDELEKENRAEWEERYKIAQEAKDTEKRFSEYQERLQAGEKADWIDPEAPHGMSKTMGYIVAAIAILILMSPIIMMGIYGLQELFSK